MGRRWGRRGRNASTTEATKNSSKRARVPIARAAVTVGPGHVDKLNLTGTGEAGPAPPAAHGLVSDHDIRVGDLLQRPSLVTVLPAGLTRRRPPQGPGRGFRGTVCRRWRRRVPGVPPQLGFQISDPRPQRRVLRFELNDPLLIRIPQHHDLTLQHVDHRDELRNRRSLHFPIIPRQRMSRGATRRDTRTESSPVRSRNSLLKNLTSYVDPSWSGVGLDDY